MAVTIFRCYTIGKIDYNDVLGEGSFDMRDYIPFPDSKLIVRVDTDEPGLLAVSRESGKISIATIGRTAEGTLVFVPSQSKEVTREAVLVIEYSPRVGHKRWPGFFVRKKREDIDILIQARRTKGSGAEYYSLITAPLGWTEAIYKCFDMVNYRDADVGVVDIPCDWC